jgi:hypothetical protein
VGQEHVQDPAATPVGSLDGFVDIALRIDHRCRVRLVVGDEVGKWARQPR